MNDTNSVYTQLFAGFAAIASALGLSTQDLIYLVFALIGLILSIASFVYARIDAAKRHEEDKKRTAILNQLVDQEMLKPEEDRKAGVTHLKNFVSKIPRGK